MPAPQSSPLVWELIKKHNSFQRKGLYGKTFSAEKGNLYNLSTYKQSGLANAKTIHIEATADKAVLISKSRSKSAGQPKSAQASYTSKRHARKVLQSVAKEAAGFRPDLKSAAVARASAVLRSLRKIKSKKI